jgi:hypothetical protein
MNAIKKMLHLYGTSAKTLVLSSEDYALLLEHGTESDLTLALVTSHQSPEHKTALEHRVSALRAARLGV